MINRERKLIVYLYFILIGLLLPDQLTFSQNLVPNPSFEVPINFDSENQLNWHKLQGSDTPDYFNFSGKSSSETIFAKYTGGADPKTGDGFIGLFCYRVNPQRGIRNVREFVETELLKPLEKDSLYKIELSLLLDGESNIAIKNFGVMFSDVTMQSNKDLKLFKLKPQIEFNSSYLINTHNWITVQSFYKSTGKEKYIILGNFRSDKNTVYKKIVPENQKGKKEKWDLSRTEKASYYYIDDVSVEKVSIRNEIPDSDQVQRTEVPDTFNINKIEVDSAIILNNVFFNFDKYDLLPESYKELDKLYYLMKTNPSIKIRIEGHTDNIGGYQYNLELSLRRVESVARYLISKGISEQRIETAGYAFNYPIASNETEEGRKMNRRVVFKIIEK